MATFSQFELPSSSILHSSSNTRESDELMNSFAHQQQEQNNFIDSSSTSNHQHSFQQLQASGYYMSIGNCKKCFNQPCSCLLHEISEKEFTLQQDALPPRFEQLDQFETSHQQSSFRCDSSIAFNELSNAHYQSCADQNSSFHSIGRIHQDLNNAQVNQTHSKQQQATTLHGQQDAHFQQLQLQDQQQQQQQQHLRRRQQHHISSHNQTTDNQQLISSCSDNFSNDSSLQQVGDQKFTYNYKEHDNWTQPRAAQVLNNNYTAQTFQTEEQQQVIDNLNKNESNTIASYTYLSSNNAISKNFNSNEMNDFNNNNNNSNNNQEQQNLPYSTSVSPKLHQPSSYNQMMKVHDIQFQGSNFHQDCIQQHTTDFHHRYEYNQQSLDNFKLLNGDLQLDETSSQALSSTSVNQNSYEQHNHLHQNQTYQPLENLYHNLPEQSLNGLEHQNQDYKRHSTDCAANHQQQQPFDQQAQPQPQPLQQNAYTSLQQLTMSCDDYANQVSTTTTFRVDCQSNTDSPTNTNVTATSTIASSKTRPLKGRRGRPRKKGIRSKNKVNGKLWEFIRDLLLNERTNPSFIRWERREDGVFKFVQSDKVAKMWGERKQNPKMTYEKLSRAMRYYYKSKVLLPVFGRRLVYKFGPNATGWLPNEADMLF